MIRSPRFWIALAAAAVVCSFAVTQLNKTSPGPLATVHSRVAALSGVGSCANCHGGWFGDMTESCLECHDTIASHIKLGKGLHGVLEAGTAKAAKRSATVQKILRFIGVPPDRVSSRSTGCKKRSPSGSCKGGAGRALPLRILPRRCEKRKDR